MRFASLDVGRLPWTRFALKIYCNCLAAIPRGAFSIIGNVLQLIMVRLISFLPFLLGGHRFLLPSGDFQVCSYDLSSDEKDSESADDSFSKRKAEDTPLV